MAVVTFRLDVDTQIAALKAWGVRTHTASEAGVQEAGTSLRAMIQKILMQREYPPSAPKGKAPAIRSGFLRDSVYQRTVELAGGYQERVFPTAVYARIHELSGWTGAGHATFLPMRPYVFPMLEAYTPEFRPVMVAAWSRAMPGR